MSRLRQAAEMALDSILDIPMDRRSFAQMEAVTALRQALAETDHFRDATKKIEPVAWHEPGSFGNVTTHKQWALENGWEPLYTAPPKREWVGLTDQEIDDLWNQHERRFDYYSYSCDLEDKLREKNT